MKFILTITIVFTTILSTAQKADSDFLDMYLDVTQKKRAAYERDLTKVEDDLYKANIRLLSGDLKAEGFYLDVEGELVPHGYFVFYYSDGKKESEGMYKMGYKVETWKRYTTEGIERSPKYYRSDLGNLLENLNE